MRCLKALFVSLQLGLGSLGCLSSRPLLAQITSDGTVNTQVNQNGNVAEITGGQTRGGNLFHSFQDFSVLTGNEAFFNNADSISNILSRVTGGNISNIDGLIRANGSASLFLINPAGIIFGENASLNIGGSFYSSTASSILFEEGEFSAVDNLQQPLLTINAPIGLSFRDEPGEIVNRSRVGNSSGVLTGLEITSGNNLAFVGGNIRFESGNATARGGNIYLGGLAEAGIVNLDRDGSLSFPEDLNKANITLTNASDVDVVGTGGGNITVDGQNLSLAAGELGISLIRGGISSNSTNPQAIAGDVTINVAENITLNDSRILNRVDSGGIGNAGNITINTDSLELINGGDLGADTLGQGNAGAVNVTATGDIIATGETSEGFPSGIFSVVVEDATGDSGGVTISTTNLNLTNGGLVSTNTLGQGNAGAVKITATGDIMVTGQTSEGFPSAIESLVNPGAIGDGGDVTIFTKNLNLTNGGLVSTNTLGQGNAGAVNITATGDIMVTGRTLEGNVSSIGTNVGFGATGDAGGITISTTNLNVTNDALITAATAGQGNAGAVKITATGNITATGQTSEGSPVPGGIFTGVVPDGTGDSEDVTIFTKNLNLTNGGRVDAGTFGQGNAGAVNVTATGDITADGFDLNGFPSGIFSQVGGGTTGDAGGITISTTNLHLTNGGLVSATTFGQGNAGAVNVTATGDITADGFDSVGSIFSQVSSGATGDAGGVTISTVNLHLTNGGSVNASTFGQGNAGAVNITATGNITADGETSEGIPSGLGSGVAPDATGDSGEVNISTTNLNLTNGGRVSASTFGQGNAGAVNVTTTGDIMADGETSEGIPSGITSLVNSGATGNSEGITISTTNLNLTNGGLVDATTFGQGNAGTIKITATGDIMATGEDSEGFPSGIFSQVSSGATGDAGGITISTTNLNLTNGGQVDASTFGQGNANNVRIDASESIFIDGASARFRSGISANAQIEDGNGGNVVVSTGNLTIANGGTIEATNFDNIRENNPGTGRPGTITINANSLNLTDNARIEAATQFTGEASGIINLNIADELTLDNNSFISAQARGDADGGNLNIDAGFIVAFPNQNNDLIASAAQGRGGNIDLTTNALFGIQERSSTPANNTNDIDASSEFGLDGTVAIIELDTNPVEGLEELPKEVIDVTRLIAQSLCQQGDLSEFIVTGKGGIAPSPNQPREWEVNEVDLVEPALFEEDGGVVGGEGDREDGEDREEIVEAQGWIINDRSVVELVAYKTSLNGSSPQPKDNNVCHQP